MAEAPSLEGLTCANPGCDCQAKAWEHVLPQYVVNQKGGRAPDENPEPDWEARLRPGEPDWVDAQAMSRRSPETFHVPSMNVLNKIACGDPVQVCEGQDKFWVVVERVTPAAGNGDPVMDRQLAGRVNNFLTGPHPFQFGDEVAFKVRHVHSAPVTTHEVDNGRR